MTETIHLSGTVEGRMFHGPTHIEATGDLHLLNCGFSAPPGHQHLTIDGMDKHAVHLQNILTWDENGVGYFPANPENIPDAILAEFAIHCLRRRLETKGEFRIGIPASNGLKTDGWKPSNA